MNKLRFCPMVKFVKIFFLLTFLPVFLSAQYDNIKFEHLSVAQGLSSGNVQCIYQDSRGFMWFGTDDGLNKYDGYKFTVYRHDPDDPLTLSNSDIWSIYYRFYNADLATGIL